MRKNPPHIIRATESSYKSFSRSILQRCLLIMALILIVAPVSIPYAPVYASKPKSGDATRRIKVNGGVIDVYFSPDQFDLPEEALVNWISLSAKAVASYYGRFPVPRLSVYLRDREGSRVGYGSTHPAEIPYIQVNIGRRITKDTLDDDWVMTHEMTHLGFPSINGSYSWIEEGLATYIEPLARARIGTSTKEEFWHDLLRHLPRDLPNYGKNGMEEASNFSEIYWGGALFWLVADVEVRKQTNNRRGLEEVLQHVISRGGTITSDWDLKELLNECDKTVNKRIFTNTYNKMMVTPINIDVNELWKQLGVELKDNKVIFNNNAPLAKIRLAIDKSRD